MTVLERKSGGILWIRNNCSDNQFLSLKACQVGGSASQPVDPLPCSPPPLEDIIYYVPGLQGHLLYISTSQGHTEVYAVIIPCYRLKPDLKEVKYLPRTT